MADAPQSNSGTPAAASALTDDPETQALLQKHNAWKSGTGPQPTQSEFGKLGAFAKWLKNPFAKSGAAPGSPQPGSAPGNPAGLATLAPGQTPGGGLAPVEIDAGLCQRTAAALLNRGDAFAVGWIEREAQASGATGEVLDRFRNSAGLPVADKKLLVEISPDVCAELGIDPRRMAVWTAVGVLGLHTWTLWRCVQELRDMRKLATPPQASTSEPALGTVTLAVGQPLPAPARPPGAPPEFTGKAPKQNIETKPQKIATIPK